MYKKYTKTQINDNESYGEYPREAKKEEKSTT